MTDIKEQLRRFIKFCGMGQRALPVDALAAIERLEAENALMRSEHAASLIRINAEACEKIAALRTSNERMETALRLVQDALHIGACEYDDVRAMLTTIEQALSTPQPVETDKERDARRASVLNTVIHPYTRWHPMFAARMARAIAESDKEQRL